MTNQWWGKYYLASCCPFSEVYFSCHERGCTCGSILVQILSLVSFNTIRCKMHNMHTILLCNAIECVSHAVWHQARKRTVFWKPKKTRYCMILLVIVKFPYTGRNAPYWIILGTNTGHDKSTYGAIWTGMWVEKLQRSKGMIWRLCLWSQTTLN